MNFQSLDRSFVWLESLLSLAGFFINFGVMVNILVEFLRGLLGVCFWRKGVRVNVIALAI